MFGLDNFELLFVIWAFLVQFILLIHFSIRKVSLDTAIKYGWIVYALSIVATVISIVMLVSGQDWAFWIGGFIYLGWALFAYRVEYVRKIAWRSPMLPRIFFPYVTGYLAMVMFYWFPLGMIKRPFWYIYAVLFIISTLLNVTSHQKTEQTMI